MYEVAMHDRKRDILSRSWLDELVYYIPTTVLDSYCSIGYMIACWRGGAIVLERGTRRLSKSKDCKI